MPQNNRLPHNQQDQREDAPGDEKTVLRRGREKKHIVHTGSRWAGVALLLLTVLLSLFFSFQGKGQTIQLGGLLERAGDLFFGSSTMTFEK